MTQTFMHGFKTKSKTDNYGTPEALYKQLNTEFNFNFDPCPLNGEGLRQADGMGEWAGRVFLNPPYSNWHKWVRHAVGQINNGKCEVIVILVPASVDTAVFHELLYNKPNVEIRFIRGRLKFNGSNHHAPFPSMIIILHANQKSLK